MHSRLEAILDRRGWLLADGATGTNLFKRGLQSGDPPEQWNVDFPEVVSGLYESFLGAGCDLILTNSFGGNRARLKLHGKDSEAPALSRISAEIGREACERHGGGAIVAGSIGPTGDMIEPLGDLPYADAVDIFHEQAESLKQGGADLLWVETLSSNEEFQAAAEACRLSGMPWCGTMSFDTAGRTMMGVTASELASAAGRMASPPIAFGANCGAGASDLVKTLLGFADSGTDLPVIAKANAGIPRFVDGEVKYDGSPAMMADYAELAFRAGARIIGGCCGTAAEHLAAMRRRLESAPTGPAPDEEEITARLGPFSYAGLPDGKAVERRPRRRRRPELSNAGGSQRLD